MAQEMTAGSWRHWLKVDPEGHTGTRFNPSMCTVSTRGSICPPRGPEATGRRALRPPELGSPDRPPAREPGLLDERQIPGLGKGTPS